MMMTMVRTAIDNDDEDYFVNDYVCTVDNGILR